MPPLNINDNEYYQQYRQMVLRPIGMVPFDQDEDGKYIVSGGELFCRMNVATAEELEETGDDFRLCEKNDKFSHTGNLRAHILKSHKAELTPVHKGTNSAEYVRELIRFYQKTMTINRDQSFAEFNPERAASASEPPPTPRKEAPVMPPRIRRPSVPIKKDGTINKAQMKAQADIKRKCDLCRDAKRKVCPPNNRDDCAIWNYFTDDSDSDESDKSGEEDGMETFESAQSQL